MDKTPPTEQRAATKVSVTDYLDYRLFLAAVYEGKKTSERTYSYQQFAKDLGFNSTNVMHQIIRGHRPLTNKAAAKISGSLGLKHKDRQYFLALVAYANAKKSEDKQDKFDALLAIKKETLADAVDQDTFDYFSEWYHPVIWELVGTKGFVADPDWIAKKLNPQLKVEQVQRSLELLQRLKLIEFVPDKNTYARTQTRISTGHRVKGMALVSYHQNMIELGKASLMRFKGTRRDVSGVTVGVSEETAQKLRSMIHAFELQLLDEAERSGGGDQVFQINIQLFPFTE